MFTPLEDERFQIGVILTASISIVGFLLYLASENAPEAVPIVQTAAPELSRKSEPIGEIGERVIDEPEPSEVPPHPVETIEDVAVNMRASLALPSLRGAEGDETRQGPEGGSGALRVVHIDLRKTHELARHIRGNEAAVQKKGRARREKRRIAPEPWQGPLPNRKGDPDE